jgi:hypothetical protein
LSGRSWLSSRCAVLLTILVLARPLLAETLRVRIDGDRLRVSATQLQLLAGRPLERLHNGRTVTYVLELVIRSERAGHALTRAAERFNFSYDLWEEKFSVARLASPARSAANLSAAAAESWCVDNLAIAVKDIPADRPFWVSLEYATEEPRDTAKTDTATLTLGGLIDIFSRRTRDDPQVRGSVPDAGPFRLQDLMKKVK